MPLDVKSTLGALALGAGGYVGWTFVKPRLVVGNPATPNPQRLRQGRGSGRYYDVQGGALSWDDRFDDLAQRDGQEYVRDRFGRRSRVGSPGSAWVAYEMVVELHRRLYQFEEILASSMTERQLEAFMAGYHHSGVYDLVGLTQRQRAVLTSYINAWIQLATCFRILSRLYQTANLPVSMRPTKYVLQRIDLSTLVIKHSSFNPISASEPDRVLTIHTPGQWEIFGLQLLMAFQAAYPTIVDVTGDDAAILQQDLVETGQRHGTMGAPVVAIAWAIAIIMVGLSVAAAIRKGLGGVLAWLGINLEYMDTLIEQYNEEFDRCAQGDQAACVRADALSNRIEQYDNGAGSLARTLVVLGVVGAGSVVTWLWWTRGGNKQVNSWFAKRKTPKSLPPGRN